MALYHSARGSVDYTIVGSPTIVDGVVSNFSLSSYVQIPAFMPGNKTWALQLKFKLNSSMTNSSALFNDTSNDFRCPKVTVIPGTSSVVFRAFVSSTGYSWNISSGPRITVDFDYSKWAYILWKFTGTQYILSFRQEGQDYSVIMTTNSSVPFYQNENQQWMSLGNDIGSAAQYNSYIDGSIDLNSTYIEIDDQTWFGMRPVEVKKHQLMGPVGYTVVGSPTIVDGIASGFGNSNYLKFSSILSDITNSDVEILATLNNAGDGSAQGNGTIMALNCVTISITNTGSPYFTVYTKKSEETSYTGRNIYNWAITTQPGKFVIKFTKQSKLLRIQGSRDGETFTTGATYTLEEGEEILPTNKVGYMMQSGRWATVGTQLDLNNTYIKVNGKLWFWQPQETKYIQRNNQLVWADPKLYLSAPDTVELTAVGSPTITNGVASGFSKNNYLSLGNFPQNVTDLEIQIKFKTGSASDVDVWQGLFSINASESGHNVYIRYNRNTRKISFSPNFLYSNENFILYSNALEYETWYTYKISKVGNVYTLYKNGVAEATATSNLAIEPNNLETRLGFVRVYTGSTVGGFNSSIDLNNTYIKVNDVMWFQYPKTTTYTVVGSPTITDGVMSNISTDNYAYTLTNSTMYQSIVSFETAIKFTTGASAPTGNLFGWQNGHGGAYINNSHRIRCVAIDFSAKKYHDYLTSFSALQANKTYYFKYEFRNNQCYCSLKEEGGEWQTEQIETGVNNFNQPSNYQYLYGVSYPVGGYLKGGASIDFNNTYIKVNGKLWFYGKNHATQNIAPVPAGYTFGTTTTPSIGYVDMRTQTFYSAPDGAVIGRDE